MFLFLSHRSLALLPANVREGRGPDVPVSHHVGRFRTYRRARDFFPSAAPSCAKSRTDCLQMDKRYFSEALAGTVCAVRAELVPRQSVLPISFDSACSDLLAAHIHDVLLFDIHQHEVAVVDILCLPGVDQMKGQANVCTSCLSFLRTRKQIPRFSLANGMWLGSIPPELSELSFVENIAVYDGEMVVLKRAVGEGLIYENLDVGDIEEALEALHGYDA